MSVRNAIVAAVIVFSFIATATADKPSANSANKIAAAKPAAPRVEKTKTEKAAAIRINRSAKDEITATKENFLIAKEELKDSNSKERLKEHVKTLKEEVIESTRKGGKPRE